MRESMPKYLIAVLIAVAAWLGSPVALAAAKAEVKPGYAAVQNDYYKYEFDTTQGLKLKTLFNRFTNDNNIKDPSGMRLGLIEAGGEKIALDSMAVGEVKKADGRLVFHLTNPAYQCRFTIAYNDTPETQWTLAVKNVSGADAKVKVTFPLLGGLVPGPSLEETWFHHGLNGQMIGKNPVILSGASGYSFPIMDIFNKKLGGLYLISHDPDQNEKGYHLMKKVAGTTPKAWDEAWWKEIKYAGEFEFDQGCGMEIKQGLQEVKADATYQTPPVVIGVHPGRWEKAWESYRDWLRSVTKPRSDNQVAWWRDVYISKAIHEGQYWKDGKFDWSDTVKPFDRDSYFDINHWMNNRGDYIFRADQGGPAAWKAELAKLRQQGIHSAFYIEACCVNPFSEVGKAHPDWAVLIKGQRFQEKGEAGKPESREYNICPGSPWKDYLAKTAARVLSESNVDAIYLDSMALRCWPCEDTAHGHPAGKGWHRNVGGTLKRVTEELDKVKPNTPLYCEFYSSDINSQYMHGSYSPGVAVAESVTKQGFDFCRAGTCLFRFYFPKFKTIDICDINEKNLGMALFNGNGTHDFFNKPEIWPYLNECARVWNQNVGAFTSDRPEALAETGNDDILMNIFPDRDKALYTLWNGSNEGMTRTLVGLKPKVGRRYVELFTHREVPAQGGEGLLVDLPKDRVAVVAELPQALKVEKGEAEGQLVASYDGSYDKPALKVYAKLPGGWTEKDVAFGEQEIPVNNNTIYNPNREGGQTAERTIRLKPSELFGGGQIDELSIALLDGKKLVDERPLFGVFK